MSQKSKRISEPYPKFIMVSWTYFNESRSLFKQDPRHETDYYSIDKSMLWCIDLEPLGAAIHLKQKVN